MAGADDGFNLDPDYWQNTPSAVAPARNLPTSISEPSSLQILIEGALLALPEYLLGVGIHEGSHALAVLAYDGEVTDISILPTRYQGRLVFGLTQYRGEFTRFENAVISYAPKFADLAIIGAYSAMLRTDHYPKNKHLQLLVVVLATGAWVDLARDAFSTNSHNDTVEVYNTYGLDTEVERLPYRALQVGVSVVAGYEVSRGIRKLFRKSKRQKKRKTPGRVVITPAYVGWDQTF